MASYTPLLNLVNGYFEPFGFECYPFKIGSYNSCVEEKFRLPHDPQTLGVFILNTPDMFEKTFLPFLKSLKSVETLRDPIDECMNLHFNEILKILQERNYDTEKIQDYELTPTRRAKILLQTVAHVSGAAHFYQLCKLKNQEDSSLKSASMGVCLHPKFGGWFAMRGVLIVKNLLVYDLKPRTPVDVLGGNETRVVDLLNKFNTNWKDNTYRDAIKVEKKYSKKQLEYFLTEPKDRKDLISKWLNEEIN